MPESLVRSIAAGAKSLRVLSISACYVNVTLFDSVLKQLRPQLLSLTLTCVLFNTSVCITLVRVVTLFALLSLSAHATLYNYSHFAIATSFFQLHNDANNRPGAAVTGNTPLLMASNAEQVSERVCHFFLCFVISIIKLSHSPPSSRTLQAVRCIATCAPQALTHCRRKH
jgi:hypothetical protein